MQMTANHCNLYSNDCSDGFSPAFLVRRGRRNCGRRTAGLITVCRPEYQNAGTSKKCIVTLDPPPLQCYHTENNT